MATAIITNPPAAPRRKRDAADNTKMHSKTFTIELPYENPLPPEHFEIVSIDVESNPRAINFNLKKYPRAVEMASNVFEDVKKEFSVRALATDGAPSLIDFLSALPPSKKRLNPTFTEWLMGLPLGWTNPYTKSNYPAWEMQFRRLLQDLLFAYWQNESD